MESSTHTTTMPKIENLPKGISRFSYGRTAFNGYRVAKGCRGYTFVKYFSKVQHGTLKKAKLQAVRELDWLMTLLDERNAFTAVGELRQGFIKLIEGMGFTVKSPKA